MECEEPDQEARRGEVSQERRSGPRAHVAWNEYMRQRGSRGRFVNEGGPDPERGARSEGAKMGQHCPGTRCPVWVWAPSTKGQRGLEGLVWKHASLPLLLR